MIELSRTTAPQATRVVGPGALALIPVGATEQHGPNLGLGTDYRIAEELAQRIAAAIGEAAVVTPAMPFGLSEHHMFAAGTITLSPDVLEGVLTDIVRSLMRHGVRHFLECIENTPALEGTYEASPPPYHHLHRRPGRGERSSASRSADARERR